MYTNYCGYWNQPQPEWWPARGHLEMLICEGGKMSSAPDGLGEQNEVRRGRDHERGLNRGAGVTGTRKERRTKGGDGSRGKQS